MVGKSNTQKTNRLLLKFFCAIAFPLFGFEGTLACTMQALLSYSAPTTTDFHQKQTNDGPKQIFP